MIETLNIMDSTLLSGQFSTGVNTLIDRSPVDTTHRKKPADSAIVAQLVTANPHPNRQ